MPPYLIYMKKQGAGTLPPAIQDISLFTQTQVASISNTTQPTQSQFSADGLELFIGGWNQDGLFRYTLGTPYDLNTIAFQDFTTLPGTTYTAAITDFQFNSDGTRLYTFEQGGGIRTIKQHSLSVGFDLTTLAFVDEYDIIPAINSDGGFYVTPDETKMLMVDQGTDTVRSFTMSAADVTTFVEDAGTHVITEDGGPRNIQCSLDGTKMFIAGDSNNKIFQYSMGTPFDVTTISYDNKSLDTGISINMSVNNVNGSIFAVDYSLKTIKKFA